MEENNVKSSIHPGRGGINVDTGELNQYMLAIMKMGVYRKAMAEQWR